MTEAEWRAATEAAAMLWFLDGKASERKQRLFTAACCRQVLKYLPPGCCHQVVQLLEQYSDGRETWENLEQSICDSQDYYVVMDDEEESRLKKLAAYTVAHSIEDGPGDSLRLVISRTLLSAEHTFNSATAREQNEVNRAATHEELRQYTQAKKAIQVSYAHDIFGNPFRPVPVKPDWLTASVTALAEGIYADRAFDRMPILADALQDAGCEEAAILDHCRGPGPHVCGCWVVDLLLGKS